MSNIKLWIIFLFKHNNTAYDEKKKSEHLYQSSANKWMLLI